MSITLDELSSNLDYYISLINKYNSIEIIKDNKVIAILKATINDSDEYRYGDELIGFLPNDLSLEEAKEMRLSEI